MWLAIGGRWAVRRRYELAPLGTTSTITSLGLAQTGTQAAMIYGGLALGSAGASIAALKGKNDTVAYAGAGGFVALADIATAVGTGWSWFTLTAWALSTGAAYAVYGPWLAQQRNLRMKLQVDTIKAKGAVPDALGLEAADPGLTGATPEETALRRGLHALTGHTPLAVDAMHRMSNGSWSCIVAMPPGRNTSPVAIMRRRTQLENNLGMPGRLTLRQGPTANDLIVKVATVDQLAGTLPYAPTEVTTCTKPVLLGQDDESNDMLLTLLYRHTLVAGATDWGKSGIINLITLRLAGCDDVDLYGIDMKPGAPELGPWAPVMKGVARTVEQARTLLEWVRAECERRGAILEELSKKGMAEGTGPVKKWVPGEHGKAIFVITDELAELVRQDKKLADLYESLLALTRFTAIQFVSATQQPSKQVFGGNTDARGNYTNRISTRVGESSHSQFIFGANSRSRGWHPELLDLPGKFLARTPEHDRPRVYRAQYVTEQDIAAAVGFYYSDVKDTEEQPALTDEPWVEAFAPLKFPDGTAVGDAWPELYTVFAKLGSATKKELANACQVSRDTAMRAIEKWTQHGVRADGRRPTRYYLPDTTTQET